MKRFLCAVAIIALLFVCAACGGGVISASTQPTPTATAAATSTATTSRNTHSSVNVNETYAKSDVVESAAQSTAPTSTVTAADTPSTGDFPVVYFAGVVGLILICSAGLLMLKKI